METLNQYTLIEYIFNYYNKALFQGQLEYQCPGCGFISWNKPNLIINCYGCFDLMIPQEGKAGKQVLIKATKGKKRRRQEPWNC